MLNSAQSCGRLLALVELGVCLYFQSTSEHSANVSITLYLKSLL